LDKIIILDEALISKIAAGEVIERPASIVKELIENSIDAKAKKISVELKDGGKAYIRVTDDGLGMSRRDAGLSWQRHATSKLRDAHDLSSIHTLGFRGEALASIASVSEMTITTRESDEITGTRIVVTGGKVSVDEEIGCPKGTTIEVKDLFFNTPARMKYMKGDEAEYAAIADIMTRFGLIYHEIQFRLTHNRREQFNWPACDDIARLSHIYGIKTAKDMVKVSHKDSNFSISGFVSKPQLSRSTREDQSFFVNRRYIKKNSAISEGLNGAFQTLIMVNRFPLAVLDIEVLPERTDVNVHPQKAEIRILDEKGLYDSVFTSVKDALKDCDLIPETIKESDKNIFDFSPGRLETSYPLDTAKQQMLAKEANAVATDKLHEINIFGIVNRTYIVAEIQGSLLLIDQHAAAERILYENFSQQLRLRKVVVQGLLEPEIIETTPTQIQTVVQHKEELTGLGYSAEAFGHSTVRVSSIPVILGRQFNKEIFIDFLNELGKGEKIESLEGFFHAKFARMACRKAIKAGDEITLPQIKRYVQDILTRDFPPTCPHGRPIMIKWSFYELEKMFKRVI
jgi:DNA mismatch repair protein MutL